MNVLTLWDSIKRVIWAVPHFMDIFDGVEPRFSLESVGVLMSLAKAFRYNNLLTGLAWQRDVPRGQENDAVNCKNSTGTSQRPYSRPIFSLFATRLPSWNATGR
jgi:hypothetical protein